jgi:glycosyltransferase involved in cell wall biosynthesis
MIDLSNKLLRGEKLFTLHFFLKELMEFADVILPNTDEELNALSRGFGIPHTKFRKIPNGVNDSFYFADPDEFKDKYGIEDFILYTGWIGSARKNTLNLVKALDAIDRKVIF